MVSGRQIRGIKKRMAAIKQAHREGASDREIEEKAQELYQFMVKEGLVQPND